MCSTTLQLVGSLTHRIIIPKECQLIDEHKSEGIYLVENNHEKNCLLTSKQAVWMYGCQQCRVLTMEAKALNTLCQVVCLGLVVGSLSHILTHCQGRMCVGQGFPF